MALLVSNASCEFLSVAAVSNDQFLAGNGSWPYDMLEHCDLEARDSV